MRTTKTASSKPAVIPKKHKSIMGLLKYAVRLPYQTNAVELVKRNR